MVTVSIDEKGLNGHILLKPNLSLSWNQNARFLITVFFILLVVSLFFGLKIGWLVLPYSGLEFLLLAASLYFLFRRYNRKEVIRFSKDRLIIERGKDKPDKTWIYQRHWSKFYIHDQGKYDIPKICLVSHGKELELGAFLSYDDKQLLIKNLIQITKNFQDQL